MLAGKEMIRQGQLNKSWQQLDILFIHNPTLCYYCGNICMLSRMDKDKCSCALPLDPAMLVRTSGAKRYVDKKNRLCRTKVFV